MPSWILKAAIQKGISLLPAHRELHFWMQKYLWRSLQITPDFLEDRLSHCHKHLTAWRAQSSKDLPEQVLELGTGWFPVVPMGLRLCGVPHIMTIDQWPHLKLEFVRELWTSLRELNREGKLRQWLPDCQAEALALFDFPPPTDPKNLPAFLDSWGIKHLVEDARALSIADNAIDLVISNNTLEHISPSLIRQILPELNRVLKSTGVMSHYIDLADHYSYSDSSISPYHFLRFTEKQWTWIENSLQSQNRLRISQYRQLFQEQNLKIVAEMNEWGPIEALKQIPLRAPFDQMKREDLGVTYSHMVLVPPLFEEQKEVE